MRYFGIEGFKDFQHRKSMEKNMDDNIRVSRVLPEPIKEEINEIAKSIHDQLKAFLIETHHNDLNNGLVIPDDMLFIITKIATLEWKIERLLELEVK